MNTKAKHAAAYLRRSSVSADSPGDASKDAQQDATRRLAVAFAPGFQVVEYIDWGVSGRKDDRKDYVRLKAAIERDEVCCVLAYSLSRLGRTARELDALFTLCEAHDVQVITQADGTLTATSATGKFLRRILGELAELESELAKERSAAAREGKRIRGDKFGQPPFGYKNAKDDNGRLVHVPDLDQQAGVQAVLDAYEAAGTILGACRLLAERGVKSPRGFGSWSTSAVFNVVQRARPDLLPRPAASGVRRRGKSGALLARLLVCHCGRLLTPNAKRGQYYCSRGTAQGLEVHGRYTVTEAKLLEFVEREGAKYWGTHLKRRKSARIDDARRERLLGDRAKLIDLKNLRRFSAEEIDAQAKGIDAELELIDNAREPLFNTGRPIDFNLPDAEINAQLQRIWKGIQLDREMNPVSVAWSVPAYYYDEDAAAESEAESERISDEYQEAERARREDEDALDATAGPRA